MLRAQRVRARLSCSPSGVTSAAFIWAGELRAAALGVRRLRASRLLTRVAPCRSRAGVRLHPAPVLQPRGSQHPHLAAGDRSRGVLRPPEAQAPSAVRLMRFLLRRLGPWAWPLMLGQAALSIRRHWQTTSPRDRARVQALLRKSGGRPANLTTDERRDLFRAARRLEPGKLMRDLVVNVIRPGRGARRGRR